MRRIARIELFSKRLTSRGLNSAALRRRLGTLILSISVVLLSSHVCAADDGSRSGAEYVREGNKHLTAKRYTEALAAYDLAHEKLPDAAEVAYDRGIALYRLGRLSEAETAFQDALKPDSPELEAKAKYNLGRCSHALALAEQQDLPKAINELGRAIGFYKDALQVRPDDADAKQNVAIAERLQDYLKKRLAQQKEEEKKEPSSQPGDEKQDDDESDGDDQEQGDDQQEGQDDQKQSDKEGEAQDSDDQQPSSQPSEDESSSTQPSEKPPEESTTQSASQPSEEAATQPMTASSQPTSQPEDAEAARRRISIEQAMRMLQEARDAELQRRENRRAEKMRRRGRIPVDKDW